MNGHSDQLCEEAHTYPPGCVTVLLNAGEQWEDLSDWNDFRKAIGVLWLRDLWNLFWGDQPPCALRIPMTSSPVTAPTGKGPPLSQTVPLYAGRREELKHSLLLYFGAIDPSPNKVLKQSKAAAQCTSGVKWLKCLKALQYFLYWYHAQVSPISNTEKMDNPLVKIPNAAWNQAVY